MSNNKFTAFFTSWRNTHFLVYPAALSVVHPLISHGILGDHGVQLTGPQLFLHSVALLIFGAWLCRRQNKSLQKIDPQVKSWDGALPLLLLMPAAFWLGYYTLYIPFDILFMLLSIGAINAVRLRRYANTPANWVGQCMLTYFLAALAGIAVGFAVFGLGVMKLPFLVRDMALWAAISIPAGLVSGLLSQRFLKRQLAAGQAAQGKKSAYLPNAKAIRRSTELV